jgi:hypothetical protein
MYLFDVSHWLHQILSEYHCDERDNGVSSSDHSQRCLSSEYFPFPFSGRSPSFQVRLMSRIRQAIVEERFPNFIKDFVSIYFQDKEIPVWVTNSLASVNIHIES